MYRLVVCHSGAVVKFTYPTRAGNLVVEQPAARLLYSPAHVWMLPFLWWHPR